MHRLAYICVYGRLILKWITGKQACLRLWTECKSLRIVAQWRTLVLNLRATDHLVPGTRSCSATDDVKANDQKRSKAGTGSRMRWPKHSRAALATGEAGGNGDIR